jgi:hypothetical protein
VFTNPSSRVAYGTLRGEAYERTNHANGKTEFCAILTLFAFIAIRVLAITHHDPIHQRI